MTLDEEQEFEILRILIDNKVDKFTFPSLPKEIKDIIGSGDWNIIRQMASKGLFADLHQSFPEFEVTNAAKTRFNSLKRKKRTEFYKTIAFWVTLAAAIISAIYAVLTYYQSEATKSQAMPRQELLQKTTPTNIQQQPKKILLPDTLKSNKIASHFDTSKPTPKTK